MDRKLVRTNRPLAVVSPLGYTADVPELVRALFVVSVVSVAHALKGRLSRPGVNGWRHLAPKVSRQVQIGRT